MRKNILITATLFLMSFSIHSQIKTITYKGKPGYVHEKTPADFPAYFQNNAVCEENRDQSDAKARCVSLLSDGNGFFQNDYFNANDKPKTPIKWYVVCNEKGETVKFESDGRTQYLVMMQYTQDYYYVKANDYVSLICTLLKSSDGRVTRVLIDSKFKNL